MACHSAVRAGQALSLQEMKALLTEMDDFPQSSFCPHGRRCPWNTLFISSKRFWTNCLMKLVLLARQLRKISSCLAFG